MVSLYVTPYLSNESIYVLLSGATGAGEALAVELGACHIYGQGDYITGEVAS